LSNDDALTVVMYARMPGISLQNRATGLLNLEKEWIVRSSKEKDDKAACAHTVNAGLILTHLAQRAPK
jgi:hypothetical protein